ncbi:MAG TPA: cytochrome c oxidase assembly protein [Thermoanaerobaculia bacterium]|nr:cytochrome c oxidase assembly protein [Thermoanaerobaculia bacterium]
MRSATALSLAAIGVLYILGLARLWSREGGRHTIRKWQAAAFFAGWAATGLALLSILDRWSDILLSAHMTQHEILMLISAPLMVLGRPFIVTLWGLPAHARGALATFARQRTIGRAWELLTGPVTVLVLHALILWIWHVPTLFEAALHDETIHAFQHLGFFLTAALFWWALIHGRYGRLGYGVAILYVFATAMHTQILGALLTFGSRSWYPTHAARTAAAGVNAVADQQLAGIVMWIPFGMVFLCVALALFSAWLGEAERRVAFTSADKATRTLAGLLMLLFLTACSPEVEQHAHARPVAPPPAATLAPQDRDFLERAAKGSNAEIAMGTLAEKQALKPEVIAFGRRMVADHGAINRQLASIAARHHIALPASLGDHQASFDRIVDLRREPFDREFIKVMNEDHDMALVLFQGEANGGVDPALRAFAASTLPLIEAHLAHAKALK